MKIIKKKALRNYYYYYIFQIMYKLCSQINHLLYEDNFNGCVNKSSKKDHKTAKNNIA